MSGSVSVSSWRAVARVVCGLLGPVVKYGGLQTRTSAMLEKLRWCSGRDCFVALLLAKTYSCCTLLWKVRMSAW